MRDNLVDEDERVVLFNTGAAWKYSELLDPGNPATLDPADPNVFSFRPEIVKENVRGRPAR